jgi:soluble lytic murein transglycosylase-like protein
MTTSLLSVATASTIFVSTLFSPSSAPQATTPFTQVMPENNLVAYVVKEGDTLDSVSHSYYKDTAYWTDLWNANPWVKDPDRLEAGTSLKVRLSAPEKAAELSGALKERYATLHPLVPAVAGVAVVMDTRLSNPSPQAKDYPQSSFEHVYRQAGEKYGVPWQVLYGLHLTETGLRNGNISNHAGSGAQGPMQFMPGTWRAYEVDGDGDGVADINNAADAIYGAANYLSKHGTLMAGLRAYGGNISGTLSAAKAKGYIE